MQPRPQDTEFHVIGSLARQGETGSDALHGGGHQELDPSHLFELVFVGPAGGANPITGKL